jgi:hypothetical protein
MQDHNHRHNLNILWEQIDDPNVDDLLRQVAKLILEDRQELSPPTAVDSETLRTLNESVPVENINKQPITNE